MFESAYLYKIPIENADKYFIDFIKKFEKNYPKFKIINHYVEKIIIKHIQEMYEQDVMMLYLKNNIYISPTLKNVEYIEEGLLHEIGHILLSRSEINDNEQVKDEFFLKRKLVLEELMQDYKIPQRIQDLVKNLEEFSPELDKYFNEKIGYEKLSKYINGYFLDPYGMSSYDEYLATGFQLFYSEYRNSLQKTNPILFKEIEKLNSKL